MLRKTKTSSTREVEIEKATEAADQAMAGGNKELCISLIERLYALHAQDPRHGADHQ